MGPTIVRRCVRGTLEQSCAPPPRVLRSVYASPDHQPSAPGRCEERHPCKLYVATVPVVAVVCLTTACSRLCRYVPFLGYDRHSRKTNERKMCFDRSLIIAQCTTRQSAMSGRRPARHRKGERTAEGGQRGGRRPSGFAPARGIDVCMRACACARADRFEVELAGRRGSTSVDACSSAAVRVDSCVTY